MGKAYLLEEVYFSRAMTWDCLGDNVESFLQEERRVKELGEAYLSRARAGDSRAGQNARPAVRVSFRSQNKV